MVEKMNFSEFEMDVMTVMWRLGECSAPQVHQAIRIDKQVTYSTVKTIIDRLEKKGAVKRTKSDGRTIFLKTTIQPSKIQSNLVERLLTTVFAGDKRPLFSQLIQSETLTKDELDYLSDLVTKRQKELDDD